MDKFDENYYLRKCYLKHDQVPTQSVMKAKMGARLSSVYFGSMTPALRALGGLQPALRGAGADWYVPPRDVLAGRLVMRPVANEHLRKLSAAGLAALGTTMKEDYHRAICDEIEQALRDNDRHWKSLIDRKCINARNDELRSGAKTTTAAVRRAYDEFRTLYKSSLNRVEETLLAAAGREVRALGSATHAHMEERARALLQQQASMLSARYDKKLIYHTNRLKEQYLADVTRARAAAAARLHELSVDKHAAAARLRHVLRCERRACQLYVALQERGAARRDLDLGRRRHEEHVRALDETIRLKDAELKVAEQKQRVIAEFNEIWSKKVCRVVKKFQLFTSYCLRSVPEHAAFFIDMERLMMLQMDEALATPSAASLFEPDPVRPPPPAPPPPFVVCGDVGPAPGARPGGRPGAADLPVLLVNDRCVYARCDTFDRFTDKVLSFAAGARGDDDDFVDDHDYSLDLPVRGAAADGLPDPGLQSSLMQILQGEVPDPRGADAACRTCRLAACFCRPPEPAAESVSAQHSAETGSVSSGARLSGRRAELEHERQPTWARAAAARGPCGCPAAARGPALEHLPPYMRSGSRFEPVSLGAYEPCSAAALRRAVRAARPPRRASPPPAPGARDVGVQYSDVHFEYLCSCFDVDSIEDIDTFVLEHRPEPGPPEPAGAGWSPEELRRSVQRTAVSLARLIAESPELKEIFERKKC